MCRITGIFNPASSDLTRDIITMTDSMKHGGPDDKGIYIDNELPLALGHSRLSLLDLSTAGQQSILNIDNRLQIIFDGEIDNCAELKHELKSQGHSFKTNCHTEVILKAYLQWGTDCFRRFNGMFALALFDKRSCVLLLARDYAGIKPLYYSIVGNCLYFASEVRAFTALNPQWEENNNWKISFLRFGYLPEPITTLKNVVPLQKGTLLIINLPDLSVTAQVFNRFTFQSTIFTLSEAVTAIREKLTAAVERHLIPDAPIGLFSDNGIGSDSLALLTVKNVKHHFRTVSVFFDKEEFQEAESSQNIFDKTGTKHSAFIVQKEEFYEAVPDILQAMDQPSVEGINTYFICKYAKKAGLTTVLSEIGTDSFFKSPDLLNSTLKIKLPEKLLSFDFASGKKSRDFNKRKQPSGNLYRTIYTPAEIAGILDCTIKEVNNTISQTNTALVNKILPDAGNVGRNKQHLYVQDQLLKDMDCMSMWHGLDVKLPFLDKQLMQTIYSVSPAVKHNYGTKKHLLIKALDHILDGQIYRQKKQSFTFPIEKWISAVQTTTQRNPDFIEKLRQVKSGQIQGKQYWAYLLCCHKNTIKYYNKPVKRILFLNLKAFSITGGIEKFNRAFLKALSELEKEGLVVADGWSMHDDKCDAKYFEPEHYRCFKGNRFQFVYNCWKAGKKYDKIMIGHINLSLAGWGIKKFFPHKQIVLVTHGIEVWSQLKGIKKALIKQADQILAVSNFTKNIIADVHKINPGKIIVFHNTIDPYFALPSYFKKPAYLMDRYGLKAGEPIIFTLSRLSYSEKYKGYDKVMQILPRLKASFPDVKYVLSGKPDEREKNRLMDLSESNHIKNEVLLTGFVKDDEVTDHYLLADVFILPSRKEGFGIVFIEAMACGLQVIGGNQDGTVDALQQGALGYLIDPENDVEILHALESVLTVKDKKDKDLEKRAMQRKVTAAFGFDTYKQNLKKIVV